MLEDSDLRGDYRPLRDFSEGDAPSSSEGECLRSALQVLDMNFT